MALEFDPTHLRIAIDALRDAGFDQAADWMIVQIAAEQARRPAAAALVEASMEVRSRFPTLVRIAEDWMADPLPKLPEILLRIMLVDDTPFAYPSLEVTMDATVVGLRARSQRGFTEHFLAGVPAWRIVSELDILQRRLVELARERLPGRQERLLEYPDRRPGVR